MIQRGYDRRHRNLWSATRWQTYNLMCAFAGSKALSEAGINSAKDLLSFPWDTEHNGLPTEDEIAQAVANGYSSVDKIVIWGNNGDKITEGMTTNIAKLTEMSKETLGLDLGDLLKGIGNRIANNNSKNE